MAANLNTIFKEIDERFDILEAEIGKLTSHIAAIQHRLDEQRAVRESQIATDKPRRGRPPSNRRN